MKQRCEGTIINDSQSLEVLFGLAKLLLAKKFEEDLIAGYARDVRLMFPRIDDVITTHVMGFYMKIIFNGS